MGDLIKKEKQWMYLVFLLIGVLSFPITKYLENIFDLPLFQFPFLVYSILFAIGLYTFKERTLIFALKAFAFSLTASIFISFIGFFLVGAMMGSFLRSLLGLLLGGPVWFYESIIGPMIFFLILFMVVIYIFKDKPLINSSIKAFAISYIPLFLITSTWYMSIMFGGGVFIGVQEVQTDQIEKYIELTEEELREYYLLEKSIENYQANNINLWLQSDEYSEYERTRKFIEKKQREANFLFSIVDAELENEIKKIGSGEEVPVSVKIKLKNIFESRGFTISENHTLFGGAGELNIIGEEFSYRIITEGGKLNIYDGKYGDTIFKIEGTYYKFYFGHGD